MPNPFFDSPRTRRLRKDLQEMLTLRAESSVLEFETNDNTAPESYKIIFNGRGISEIYEDGKVDFIDRHQVRIDLGSEYPRQIPRVRFETPIAHPNISSGTPCFGKFVMHPSVGLTEIVEIAWDMARMASYNAHDFYSKTNSWQLARLKNGFPTDQRILRDKAPKPSRSTEGGEPEIFIMGAAGVRNLDWARRAVEQYLASRELSHDSHVYTRDEWRMRGEKVGNDALITIVTEGPLGQLLNYGDWPDAGLEIEQWNRFVDSLGMWWEQGYAWTVHLYSQAGGGNPL